MKSIHLYFLFVFLTTINLFSCGFEFAKGRLFDAICSGLVGAACFVISGRLQDRDRDDAERRSKT